VQLPPTHDLASYPATDVLYLWPLLVAAVVVSFHFPTHIVRIYGTPGYGGEARNTIRFTPGCLLLWPVAGFLWYNGEYRGSTVWVSVLGPDRSAQAGLVNCKSVVIHELRSLKGVGTRQTTGWLANQSFVPHGKSNTPAADM